MDYHSLPEAGWLMSELISRSPRSADPWCCSIFWCSLILGNGHVLSLNVGVDQNQKSKFMWFFDCFKKLGQKIPRNHWLNICGKNNDTWNFDKEHDENKIIIIGQWTISHNVPYLFHITKIKTKTILITHPHNFYCRNTIRNNPLCIVLNLTNPTTTRRFFEVMFDCT